MYGKMRRVRRIFGLNEIYLSTGAILGRRNGFDFRVLTEHYNAFHCDGFEFMMFRDSYDSYARIPEWLRACRSRGIRIAAFHADKHIGDLLSDPDELSLSAALALFEKNCEYAAAFGADRVIVHCWGVPDSDKNAPMLYERIGLMLEIAAQYSVEMLIEGIFCTQKSPLFHMKKLAVMYDTLGFTLDTRCAQFHRELYTMLDDKELWPDRIRHVHIGDYSGGRCDWSKIYPMYQPGAGDINWLLVFDRLRANGYTGALTLEAPAVHAKGVDVVQLNTSLDYLRAGMADQLGELPPDKAGLRHKGTVELETERLRLRRFIFEDYIPMFERWSGTEEAARFGQLLRHKTPAKAKFQVQRWITSYREDSFYAWAVEEKATGRLIGYIVGKELSNRFKTLGIMFALEQPARHKGYMTEALKRVFAFLFEEVNFWKIYAHVDVEDTAALSLMRSVGMTYESTSSDKTLHGDGKWFYPYFFSIIQPEWETKEKQAASLPANPSIPLLSQDS